MLVVQHRVWIRHGRGHEPAGVFGGRRHHNFQAGRAIEPGLGVLAVIRPAVAHAAPRHPHHHRHLAAPPVADLRGVVHELIEARCHEVVELHLADRTLPGQGRAHADPQYRAFGQRRIDDALAELFKQRAQQQEGVAVGATHVLAIHEHSGIGAQGIANTKRHGLEQRAAGLFERGKRLQRWKQWRSRPGVAAGRLEHFDASPRGFILDDTYARPVRLGPRFGNHPLRLRLDQRVGPLPQPPKLGAVDDLVGLESCGVPCDRIASRPELIQVRVGVAALVQRRILPRRRDVLAQIEHVVVVCMAAHAHGHKLDQHGTGAGPGSFGRPREGRRHRVGIGAVDGDARDAVAQRLVREHARGRVLVHGR